MKKIIKYTTAFVLSFLIGMGIARITKAQESSLLWKVSGNDLQSPSYLFGTLHLACQDQVRLKKKVKSALSATSQVVFELDMDDPELMTAMQQQSVTPDMKNIKDDLTDEQKELLNEQLVSLLGAGIDQVGILKPFAIYSAIMSTLPSCEQVFSFEEALMSEAQLNNLEIYGLETVEQQFSFIDSIPRDEQVDWVVSLIEDPSKYAGELNKMTETYMKEDVFKLHDMFMESPEFSSYAELLLYKRNRSWVPVMIQKMEESPSFFAVGAAHLGADDGLIRLLRNKGYTVEAVVD